MKVFVATSEMQGTREDDECSVPEGQIVFYLDPGETDVVWARHGAIVMYGLDGGYTTTFKVADIDISEDEFFKQFMALKGFDDYEEDDVMPDRQDARTNLAAAAVFPEKMVLERRGFDIQPRSEFNFRFPYEP